MMKTLGLGISKASVRAVLVDDGVVEWAAETKLDAVTGTEGAIRKLLDDAPTSRRSRPRVRAALGPWASQIKGLGSVPDGLDLETLDRLVADNSGTFFLENGVPLTTTTTQRRSDRPVAAALHAPLLDAIGRATQDHGLRLEAVFPTGEVLLASTPGDRMSWRDGELSLEVHRDAGGAPTVRAAFGDRDETTPDLVGGLSAIGPDAGTFADAYGAAVLAPGGALGIFPGRRLGRRRGRGPRDGHARRYAFLTIVIALAGLAAPLGFTVQGRRSAARLEAVRTEGWSRVLDARAELGRVTAQLEALRRLAARPTVTRLVAELAASLPEGAAVTAVRLEGFEAHVEVVAANAAEIAAALGSRAGVEAARLDGPVSRVELAGAPMEEATIVVSLVFGEETIP
ncbi:MAG: hypothetical protein MJB57_07630 [Gemmatimonadetes bacterium]|nr:hypothetical protein [Gemmatimonadota bacterium]